MLHTKKRRNNRHHHYQQQQQQQQTKWKTHHWNICYRLFWNIIGIPLWTSASTMTTDCCEFAVFQTFGFCFLCFFFLCPTTDAWAQQQQRMKSHHTEHSMAPVCVFSTITNLDISTFKTQIVVCIQVGPMVISLLSMPRLSAMRCDAKWPLGIQWIQLCLYVHQAKWISSGCLISVSLCREPYHVSPLQ